MIESVSKPKLPKGLTYVLKTSQLEKALASAEIDCHVDLVYWKPQCGGSILEVHFWHPNEIVRHSRVYVRAGAVPSSTRAAASDALVNTAIPRFIEWLQRILSLPKASPLSGDTHYFNAAICETGLSISEAPTYKRRKP